MRKIIRDKDGEVQVVLAVAVEVKRDRGGKFFLCSIGGRQRGRSKDIEIATQSMRSKSLRRRIIAIFTAKGSALEDIIEELFPKYKIPAPHAKDEERRSAFRPRHKSRGGSLNFGG